MLSLSLELLEAFVSSTDIADNPEIYPRGVVDALNKLMADQEKLNESGINDIVVLPRYEMYRFPGYIIALGSNVSIRPDASKEVKEEWMDLWKRESSKSDLERILIN